MSPIDRFLETGLAERAAMRPAEGVGAKPISAPAGRLGARPGRKERSRGRRGGTVNQITLLAESTRRVGTAWPAAVSKAECGGGKAAAKDSRPACASAWPSKPKQQFAAEENASPQLPRGSSRLQELKVEIINPSGLSSGHASSRGASADRRWGWGAPNSMGFRRPRQAERVVTGLERGVHGASSGSGERIVQGSRSLHP